MLCQNCGENEANVKYTQIINGVKKQMNLCEGCARKLGIENISFKMPSIDISNFLGGMFEGNMADFIPSLIKPETLLCNKCGSSYEEFIDSGKFGCDECYNTFSSQIDALLKNIHGVNRHVGRNGKILDKGKYVDEQEKNEESKRNLENEENTQQVKNKKKVANTAKEQNTNEIEKLKERLKQEIKEERYEDAAKTRDEIKKLEK